MFKKARQSTKRYHINLYKKDILFKKGTWLEKPEPDIVNIGKKLLSLHNIQILDLGSGIGRNAIPLAQTLKRNGVIVTCVDYLPIAIEKLQKYAKKYRLEPNIIGYISSVEDFLIKKNQYDLIISHGVLAHVKDRRTLLRILKNIKTGTKKGGYVYLSIASDLKETEVKTKKKLKPVVEVCLKSDSLIRTYKKLFREWNLLIIRVDPYTEYYEEKGVKVEWKCNFAVLIAQKI